MAGGSKRGSMGLKFWKWGNLELSVREGGRGLGGLGGPLAPLGGALGLVGTGLGGGGGGGGGGTASGWRVLGASCRILTGFTAGLGGEGKES